MQLPGTDGEESKPKPDDPPARPSPAEASHEADGTQDEPFSSSSFELARRVLVGMVQAVEDGADLLGASVREELGRFRTDLVRSLVATIALAAGGGLLTAGVALWMHAWVGSWPAVLLVLGGVYLAAGVWLFASTSASGHEQ